MSIYRKIAPIARSDVHADTAAAPGKAPTASGATSDDAEKSKRRKGAPMDSPLPRTKAWMETLPTAVQPIALMRSYARIANLVASDWSQPDVMYETFDALLHDRRGHRKGFPSAVMAELLALRTHYLGLHPQRSVSWENLTKR